MRATLTSPEYADLAADYRRLTRRHYPHQAVPPGMELRSSLALFPDADVLGNLRTSYDEQCSRLCYGEFPAFDEVLAAFEEIRDYLVSVPE